VTTLIEDLDAICSTIFERWDQDMRSGKLLQALSGELPRYDPRVTRIREALAKMDATASPPITSADCKNFLVARDSEYMLAVEATTYFRRKTWKRVRKFTDAEGRICREFANTGIPVMILVVETKGDLTVERERGIGMWEKEFEPFEGWYGAAESIRWEEKHLWPTLRPEDFAFGVTKDDDEIMYFIQPKTCQKGEGWDQHLGIDHLLPEDMRGSQVCESTFSFGDENGNDEFERLIALGFTHDPDLDDITGS
jgi:hypothetical protein